MKRKIFCLLALLWLLTGCAPKAQEVQVPDYPIIKNDGGLRVAVVSDLHVGAQDAGNVAFDGDYLIDILDAFADDLVEEGVEVLILSGDITNSSRYTQHQRLIEKLSKIEEKGIEVCAIAGNHDIGKMKAYEFRDFYSDFGYGDAVGCDEGSLSYSYLVGDTLFILIDTDGYTDYRYAEISKGTLTWLEKTLNFARENNLTVLPVGHYPVLTRHSTEFHGGDDFISLLKKYNVPLYVSGHLHGRNVTVSENLCELVVEQLTTYPCSYAILDIDCENITYLPKKLSISQWAEKNGKSDNLLLHFEELGQISAQKGCESLVDSLCEKNYASPAEKKKRREFFGLLTQCRQDGTLYDNREMLLSHSGYPIFMRICQGSNYAPWLPTLFENANPYTAGFTINSGRISALK